jgi:hypothetical protein
MLEEETLFEGCAERPDSNLRQRCLRQLTPGLLCIALRVAALRRTDLMNCPYSAQTLWSDC